MKDLKDQLKDKETGNMVKQAIKDDQALSSVVSDIPVTVKAVGVVDQVKNRIEVTDK